MTARAALPRRERAAWIPLVALALGLRLYHLGHADVWIDEANAIRIASGPLRDLPRQLAWDSSPPLYYAFLHVWMALFGDGPFAVRLPSALFGTGVVLATFGVGRRALGPSPALLAALVVAVSPVAIFHAQQARMYALLPLLALGATHFWVRHLEDGRGRDLALALGLVVLALYTHNFAFHLLVALAALALVSGRFWRRLPRWILAAGVVAAAYAPWVPTFLEQLERKDHYAWFLPLWELYGSLGAVWRTFLSYSPAGEFVLYEHPQPVSFLGIPAVFAAGLAVVGAARVVADARTAVAAWPLVLLALPIASGVALSHVVTPHYVPGRVDQMMFPAFALLAGAGLASLRPAFARAAAAIAVVAMGLAAMGAFTVDYRALGFDGSDRELAAAIAAENRAGDVVLCTSLTRPSLEYYLRRAGVEATLLSYPRDTALHPAAQNDRRLYRDFPALLREAEVVIARARESAGPRGRLFVVRDTIAVNDALSRASLARRFDVEETRVLGRFVQAGTEEILWLTLNRL